MPPPFSMGVGGGGGDIKYHRYPYVHSSRPVRNTNGFRAISFEKIGLKFYPQVYNHKI